MTKTKSYKTTDGQLFEDINAARQHELLSVIVSGLKPNGQENNFDDADHKAICKCIVDNADKIIDLLTTKATSRPAARKVNRKKKGVTVETPVANIA